MISILYENAIYGGKDFKNTGIILDPNTSIESKYIKELYDKKIYKDTFKINKISDAIINTVINLDTLDLTEYLKENGEEKTRQTIININSAIENKFNCTNITKHDGTKITKFELLAIMYNLSLPYGMGIISHDKNLNMTSSYIEKYFLQMINHYIISII